MTTSRAVLLLSVLVIAVALAYRLGGYPLLEPDEGRNAEVAREMAATNDFVLPRLNGLPYLDKPVLYFAAGAVAMKAAGTGTAAARLPSLLFTIATLLVVALLGHTLFGPDGAWTAVMAYAASPFTVAYARVVIFDSALCLFVVLACAAFFFATEPPASHGAPTTPTFAPHWARGWWGVIGWAAVALGVLTKGPVALAVPLLVALPYAAWRRRLRAVLDPVGLLVFVALVLPWVLAMQRRIPDYLQYVFVVETLERVFTDRLGRTEPFWYFVPLLVGAALPWTVVLLAGARRSMLRPGGAWDRRTVFLLLWIAVPLVFFSLSRSKRPQYILPLVPGLALLVARLWSQARGRLPGATGAGWALVAIGAALAAFGPRLGHVFGASDGVSAAIPATALALGAVSAAGGVAAVVLARHRQWVLLALALPVAAIPVVGMRLMQAIGEDRSSAGLVTAIAPALNDETEIVAIGVYPLSLPFYAGRALTLVTAHGGELTSNFVVRHVDLLRRLPGSPLRPADWWREAMALCDRPRVFLVAVGAREIRRALSALPLLAENRKVAAYGPCGRPDLARGTG